MRPSPGLQPACWFGGGRFVLAVLQAALHPRSPLPPPRRSGLRFPSPVGHGRGLASLSGCAVRGKASVRLGFARLHPRPGKRRSVPAASPAASRCSPSLATLPVCLGYCPTDSGGATTDQHYCHVHRRKPARLRRAGSRLGFYRSPVTAMSSSHRLTAARFRPLPGETRLTKGFCPFPPPIRQ